MTDRVFRKWADQFNESRTNEYEKIRVESCIFMIQFGQEIVRENELEPANYDLITLRIS